MDVVREGSGHLTVSPNVKVGGDEAEAVGYTSSCGAMKGAGSYGVPP